jgi:hypothetical protein
MPEKTQEKNIETTRINPNVIRKRKKIINSENKKGANK